MKLCNMVDVLVNDEKVVILRRKAFMGLGLISLGCFSGKETHFRIYKGEKNTVSIKDENNMTWHPLVDAEGVILTQKERRMAQMVRECVELDYGIYIGVNFRKVSETMHVRTLQDQFGSKCNISMRYWEPSNPNVMVYKDDEFLKSFSSLTSATDFIRKNFKVIGKTSGLTISGGCVEHYNCIPF